MSQLLTGILSQIQDLDDSYDRLQDEVKAEKHRREAAEERVKRLTASRQSLLEMLDEKWKDIREDVRLEKNYRSAIEELDAVQSQLKEARQVQDTLRGERQNWEYDLEISKREVSHLQSELMEREARHSAEIAQMKDQHLSEVAELKLQVTTLTQEKASIEKTIMKERQAFSSSRAIVGTDTMWKNRINQIKAELEHTRIERDRYRAMTITKGL